MSDAADERERLAGHPVHLVTATAPLAAAAARWREVPAIAIDSEFERSNTYYATPGLLQVFDGEAIWLVDPRADIDLTPLLALVTAPAPRKIVHSAGEDVELLQQLAGRPPTGLMDTQIAAGLAGLGPAISYRDLVARVCGVELEKGETRSDWLRRPLSAAQLHYAALDVAYLLAVAQWLDEALARLGRSAWADEDSQRLVASAGAGPDLERMYREFKLAWKLPDAGRAVLRALLAWRERRAAERNLPRRRVLDDDAVLALAQRRPDDAEAIAAIAKLGRRKSADVAAALADLVAQAASSPAPPAPPPPLDRDQRQRLKDLKQIVDDAAAPLAIDPTLLASRRDLLALLAHRALPERLQGWRRAIVGDALLAAVTER